MPRVKKPAKVKEPVRLRTKKLADGSQSLYLDIYRFGKRTYEYLSGDHECRQCHQVEAYHPTYQR